MNRFRLTAVASAMILAGSLAVSAHAADNLRIGLAGPTTGPVTQYGNMVREGALTAIELINAAGGVNGRQLEAVVYDDACEPKQGPIAANRAVNDDVNYVVGHVCSGATIAAAPIYDEEGIVRRPPGRPTMSRRRSDGSTPMICPSPWPAPACVGSRPRWPGWTTRRRPRASTADFGGGSSARGRPCNPRAQGPGPGRPAPRALGRRLAETEAPGPGRPAPGTRRGQVLSARPGPLPRAPRAQVDAPPQARPTRFDTPSEFSMRLIGG